MRAPGQGGGAPNMPLPKYSAMLVKPSSACSSCLKNSSCWWARCCCCCTCCCMRRRCGAQTGHVCSSSARHAWWKECMQRKWTEGSSSGLWQAEHLESWKTLGCDTYTCPCTRAHAGRARRHATHMQRTCHVHTCYAHAMLRTCRAPAMRDRVSPRACEPSPPRSVPPRARSPASGVVRQSDMDMGMGMDVDMGMGMVRHGGMEAWRQLRRASRCSRAATPCTQAATLTPMAVASGRRAPA
jgi:hypothetical protein